ncbi:hypothetical protein RhiirB3_533367 [Rhizophagus irregularis]|nr:hypothetical protein RhiirB3_533367 [Rhizophagus irregularis]
MDPKILNDHSYDLTKKSDIYSLAALFWQLTSCRPPFEILVWRFALLTVKAFQSRCDSGPKPVTHFGRAQMTNTLSFIKVRMEIRCWEFEPDDRPDISE